MPIRPLIIAGLLFASSCAQAGPTTTGYTLRANSIDVVAVDKGVADDDTEAFSELQGSQGDAKLKSVQGSSADSSNAQGQGGGGSGGGGSGSGGGKGSPAGGGQSNPPERGLLNLTDGLQSDATLPARDAPASDVAQVPEPPTGALLLVGLAGVGLFGRRRK
jgi:hypothetical protein